MCFSTCSVYLSDGRHVAITGSRQETPADQHSKALCTPLAAAMDRNEIPLRLRPMSGDELHVKSFPSNALVSDVKIAIQKLYDNSPPPVVELIELTNEMGRPAKWENQWSLRDAGIKDGSEVQYILGVPGPTCHLCGEDSHIDEDSEVSFPFYPKYRCNFLLIKN